MYAVGVFGGAEAGGGGVYLISGNANGSLGSYRPNGDYLATAGARVANEPYGHYQGRWFVFPPFGVWTLQMPSSPASYNGRTYITGGFSYNVVLDEHHRMWKQGIRPPEEQPDITGATGTGTFAYFSWYDELTGERSSLSKGTEISAAVPRTWQNLPQRPPDDVYIGDDSTEVIGNTASGKGQIVSIGGRMGTMRPGDRLRLGATEQYSEVWFPGNSPDPITYDPRQAWAVEGYYQNLNPDQSVVVLPVTRATHLELWISLAGDYARLAMRVPIGTTSVVESKTLADLGEAFITPFQRLPRCTMNAVYHDRQILAGDPENPDTVYLSELFYPERFTGASFRTRDGRPITGLLATRDYCLVFTRNSTYMLQGYTDNDYSMTVVDQSIGSVGHKCNITIHGNPYIWTEKGPMMFNGSWHPLSPENRWLPVSDSIVAPASPQYSAGQMMEATEDPYFNTYIMSNAHVASRELGHPFADQNGLLVMDQYQSVEVSAHTPTEEDYNRFFAVLDYTMVQPEAGGGQAPARLSFDSAYHSDLGAGPYDTAAYSAGDYHTHTMKYLRNRWGQGALFYIGAKKTRDSLIGGTLTFGQDQLRNHIWHPGIEDELNGQLPVIDYSFYFVALDNLGWLVPLPSEFDLEAKSKVVTPFDFLLEPGGYSMEQKSIKKFWYHMRMWNGTVDLRVAPGPGFWGGRLDGVVDSAQTLYAPTVARVTFTDGVWKAVERELSGDIVMPVLPDFLAGRGLWVQIEGKGLQFQGFGGYYIHGTDSYVNSPIPIES